MIPKIARDTKCSFFGREICVFFGMEFAFFFGREFAVFFREENLRFFQRGNLRFFSGREFQSENEKRAGDNRLPFFSVLIFVNIF